MSNARDRIIHRLGSAGFAPLEINEQIADLLMPIVRDTVAEGFDTAADQLAIDSHPDPIARLRQWARDARAANQPAED
jgi:hypothetical protein